MSEIKPRQYWLGENEDTFDSDIKDKKPIDSTSWYDGYNAHSFSPTKVTHLIEAAPVLQMMNELAAILLTRDCDKIINHEGSGMFNKHHPGCLRS